MESYAYFHLTKNPLLSIESSWITWTKTEAYTRR